jgi:uncharacterized GH25 family protein
MDCLPSWFPAAARARARAFCAAVLVVSAGAPSAVAHDLFFRSPRYRLAPGQRVVVDVLNGTFSKSDNAIERERLADLSVVTPSGRVALDVRSWTETEPKSTLEVATAAPGTYLVGAAIKPRVLKLSGREFGAYLKEEGLDEVLARRVEQKRVDEPSRERYSKYLKALLQVGDTPTDVPALGHAAEIVPDQHPYRLKPGDELSVRCLVDSKPWAGRVVFAGGREGTTDRRLPQQRLVTDGEGRARVRLGAAGVWYVKFVAMREVDEAEVNYESLWATLRFAVGAP